MKSELDTPTIGRAVPAKKRVAKKTPGWLLGGGTKGKRRLRLTEPPNRLPATDGCLSQPRTPYKLFHPRRSVR